MEPTSNKKVGIIVGAVVVLVIVLVIIFTAKGTPAPVTDQTSADNSNSTTAPAQVPPVSQTPPADTTTEQSASVYKDGSYTATGSYISPGGPDHVGVTLTLANDIITDITVTPEPGDSTSAHYQGLFVSGYKPLVVGKNIADVNLTKVSGSSLTPKGFNDALAQIKTQAKA